MSGSKRQHVRSTCVMSSDGKGTGIKKMNYILWCTGGYLLIMNLAGIAVMGMDKSRARKHQWRISEKALFAVSIFGGSIGTWAGMYLFRHKTKHWYFVIGMPLVLVLQLALAGYLMMHMGSFLGGELW